MATIEAYTVQDGKVTRYMVRYRKPDRKQTTKRGFETKRDAERFAREVETAKDRGEYIDPRNTRKTVGDLGPEWLERKRLLKPSTHRVMVSAWKNYVEPEWAEVRLHEIRPTRVQAWVTRLSVGDERAQPVVPPKSATIVQRAFGVLAGILDDAVRDNYILKNPIRHEVNLPKKDDARKLVYLTHEQVHALAQASKYPHLVLTLAYTGLRWGEATALRVRDVNLERRRLHVRQNAVDVAGKIVVGTPKGKEARQVPYPAFLDPGMAAAVEGRHVDDLIFPGPDGRYMKPARVHAESYSWLASAIDKAGVPRITAHDLRHTAASLAVSAGANVKVLQKMLGHKSAAMTLDVYSDLFEDDLDAVAVALNDAASQKIVLT